MQVCFVSRENVNDFCCAGADVVIFGFRSIAEEVSYERELKGETKHFEDIAILSKDYKNVVVCGCMTDTMGLKRKSAVVAQNGKILGVADMLYSIDRSFNPGAGISIFDTQIGKIGLIVGTDLFFPDLLKSLSLCGCEYIICPYGEVFDGTEQVVARAYAFLYGIPIFLCGIGYSAIANGNGELCFSSPHSPILCDVERKKDFHLVESRERGRQKAERGEF